MNIMLEDVNKLLTKAIREIKAKNLPFTRDNIYILLGVDEREQTRAMTYSGMPGGQNGFDLLSGYNIKYLPIDKDEYFGYCYLP